MSTLAIPSSISPTGYVSNSGAFVNADGSAYTGSSSSGLSSVGTTGTPTNLTSGAFNQIGGTASGLTMLTPSETNSSTISLTGAPDIIEAANQVAATQYNPQPMQSVQEQAPTIKLADGGGVPPVPQYGYTQTGFQRLSPSFSKGAPVQLYGIPGQKPAGDMGGHLIGMHAEGGSIAKSNIPEGHNPQFFSEGGLQHAYVRGEGDGTSDSVPAMLAAGEFVVPADVVSSLGNGDNDSGAKTLAEFLKTIREHKRAADAKQLPPDSKGPLGYLTDAKRKVKA